MVILVLTPLKGVERSQRAHWSSTASWPDGSRVVPEKLQRMTRTGNHMITARGTLTTHGPLVGAPAAKRLPTASSIAITRITTRISPAAIIANVRQFLPEPRNH